MSIRGNVPLLHEIRHNGAFLMRGDKLSIGVIFNNLTGRNFDNPPSWSSGSHAEYLAMMEGKLNVSFRDSVIELVEGGKQSEQSHRFS